MMASQQTKLHDPMYTFDTHFPERLSRLHMHGDLNASGSFRRKKGRTQRSGNARYKTQPVTFDEIKEVDEEPNPSGASGSNAEVSDSAIVNSPEHVLGQLQAFSRSMDGLLPKSAVFPEHLPFHPHTSHTRSGSRKFQRHPDCIPEKVEGEPTSPDGTGLSQKGLNMQVSRSAPSPPVSSSDAQLAPPGDAKGGPSAPGAQPVPSPNIAPRRQKITAKAKKRQKAQGDGDSSADT